MDPPGGGVFGPPRGGGYPPSPGALAGFLGGSGIPPPGGVFGPPKSGRIRTPNSTSPHIENRHQKVTPILSLLQFCKNCKVDTFSTRDPPSRRSRKSGTLEGCIHLCTPPLRGVSGTGFRTPPGGGVGGTPRSGSEGGTPHPLEGYLDRRYPSRGVLESIIKFYISVIS